MMQQGRTIPGTTGILLHGRHLQAVGWREMMWGAPENNQLGSLPMTILCILNERPEYIGVFSIGSGASQDEHGTLEAVATKNMLLEKFDALDEFSVIRNHRLWPETKEAIRQLAESAITDTDAQNTAEEIANAATLFAACNVTKVIEVTGASHAPRCQLLQGTARSSGVIPPSQHWQLVADDIAYPGTKVSDTLVFEEPHRSDDPILQLPKELRPTKVFRSSLTIPNDEKAAFMAQVAALTTPTKQK